MSHWLTSRYAMWKCCMHFEGVGTWDSGTYSGRLWGPDSRHNFGQDVLGECCQGGWGHGTGNRAFMYLAAWPWAWKQILYPTPSTYRSGYALKTKRRTMRMSLITRVSSHCYGHSTSAAVEVVSALHAYDLDRVKHRHLSRFGHVFVGIDASSKLLIWGGSINKLELRCMSKSDPLVHWGPRKIVIWLTGVCHSLIARVVLGTPFYAILRHSHWSATPSCYLLLFTTTCGNVHELNMWVRQSNCKLVVFSQLLNCCIDKTYTIEMKYTRTSKCATWFKLLDSVLIHDLWPITARRCS